jgi:hypothetical protein
MPITLLSIQVLSPDQNYWVTYRHSFYIRINFQDLNTVDPNFVKLYKLAQLTIEYLLVSIMFI